MAKKFGQTSHQELKDFKKPSLGQVAKKKFEIDTAPSTKKPKK